MKNERLNGLAQMYIHREVPVDIYKVIDTYGGAGNRRLQFVFSDTWCDIFVDNLFERAIIMAFKGQQKFTNKFIAIQYEDCNVYAGA